MKSAQEIYKERLAEVEDEAAKAMMLLNSEIESLRSQLQQAERERDDLLIQIRTDHNLMALDSELHEMKQERDALRQKIEQLREDLPGWKMEIAELKKLIDRKDEALRFYANEENYQAKILETEWGPNIAIVQDSGKRAREAL